MLLDIKATNFNPNTDVLTPSVVPNSAFTMTLDGPAPTLVPSATPNGSPALSFGGATGFDFNQNVGGTTGSTGVTILAFVMPTAATSQPGTLVAAGQGSIDYRISQTGNPDSTGDRQDLLAAQQADWGTSNTALSTTTFNIIDVTIPAGGGTANFRLNGASDGSVNVGYGEYGISRFAAAQQNAAGGDQEQYSGDIAELQYWSGVLTTAQIQTIENQFTASYITPLPTSQLTWSGNTSSLWDTTTADNFQNSAGVTTTFATTGDTAVFSDYIPGTTNFVSNSNVVIQSGGLTPAAVVVNSGSVNYSFSDNDGVHGISGTTGINKSGASILTLSGSNSFTGPVLVGGGTVIVAANGALGSTSGVNVSSGNVYVPAGVTIPSSIPFILGTADDTDPAVTFNQSSASSTLTFSNPITLTSDAVIGVATGTLTLPTTITGTGGLGISSPGIVKLTGSNTYSGQTIVVGGDLVVTSTGSINGANAANSGYLTVSANSYTAGQTAVSGRFEIDGGTVNLTSSSQSTVAGGFYGAAGALVLNSGTLNITAGLAIGGGYQSYGEFLANGGNATIKGTLAVGNPYGTGVLTLSTGSTVTASSPILPGVAVEGAFAASTVNLNGGTLLTSSIQGVTYGGGAFGSMSFNGGTLKALGNTASLISNLQTANIFPGGATVDDGGNATVIIPQSLSAATGLGVTSIPVTSPGTGYAYAPIVEIVDTSGQYDPNPATAVANYSNGQVTGITITNPGSYSSTAVLTAVFVGGGGTAPTIGTPVTATNTGGGFTKVGSGVLTLSGNNTYTGPTKIMSGTLRVAGIGASVPVVNPSFEATAANGYTYNPSDPGWTYSASTAGIADGSVGFSFFNYGPAPDGSQVAFIQKTGSISQSITFPTSGTYTLSFYTAQRYGGNDSTQNLDVYLDNNGTFTSGSGDLTPGGFTPDQTFEETTLLFNTSSGSHTLYFAGLDTNGGDNTAYVDDIMINALYTGGAATSAIPSVSPVVISANATLDINSSIETVGSLTGPALSKVTLGSGVLTIGEDGTNTTFAGTISDGGLGGSLVKIGSGVQTLTGSNTYKGSTNVSGGTLIIGVHGALPANTPVVIGLGALLVADSQATISSVASLDVSGNMIVHNGSINLLTTAAAAGYNNGTWTGSTTPGAISSSAAATDSNHLTAVGVILNTFNGSTGATALVTTFEGQPVTNTDVLVKYTYYGDTDLSGSVDGTDYSRIDNAYSHNLTGSPSNQLTGWFNGDFNYDGVVNGSDYTLMDNTFNQQGAAFTAQLATATAQIGGSSAVPEPASLGILAMGAAGLLGRRRRAN